MRSETSDKELRVAKILGAHVQSVWNAWTRPDEVAQWWAPAGFTTFIHKMDVAEGGEWLQTLHGPDGKTYPNKAIFREIIPREKIVYEHFNPDFIATAVFHPQGNRTLIEWTLTFPSKELFDIVVKTFKADEGLKQNVEKLEAYLSQKTG